MEGTPGERPLWPVRVGVPAVRTLVSYLFAVIARVLFRFAVLARERYQHLPGTLVVINHQSDWDGPIVGGLVCLISGPRGVGRRTSFLTRGDLGRPDFIPKYLLPGRGWARVLLGRVSLAPIIEALGVRSVPSLDDPLAGTRRERVRMVRAALDRAAFELDRGGGVMVAPEGRFTPDGALAPISGSVARLGPHARVIQPVTITYDPTQPGRTGLTVNFQDPIFPAGYAAGDFLEEEVSRRLRSGIVFGLGQMAGLLATAGLPAEAALRNLTPDHLAGAVAGLSVALSAAGRTVDPSLLRITSAGLWRRWRRWKARGSAGPVGEPATHGAGNRAPWALAYWSRQAADALRDLPGPERERVFGTAAAWARAVTTGAATAGAAAADAADDVAGARVGVGRARLRLWLARVEPWLRPIGTTAVFILTVLAVGYMFRKVPLNKVVEATRGYSLSWMVVGLTLNLAGYFTRVPVWRAFLEEAPRPVSTREVFDLYIGGAFINNFVPLRGGDVARVVYLAKQMGLGWGRGVTLVAAEHAFDLVVIGGYGVVGVLLTPAAPVWAGHLVGAFLAAASFATVLLALLGRPGPSRPVRLWHRIRESLAPPGAALRDPLSRQRVILGTLATNLSLPLSIMAFFRAAGLVAPLGPLLLASAVMTIGVGLPLTFANLGAYELIFAAVYTAFTGWPTTEVISVAMVSHLATLGIVLTLGGFSLVHLGLEAPRADHRPTSASL